MSALQTAERSANDDPCDSNNTATPEGELIRKAAVIGAGSMGSGIAAHLANAGVAVLLLDVVPADAGDRNILTRAAVERQLKAGGFMHPSRADLIEIGNVEDDFERLADAEWIVEAVFEDLEIKRALYRRIEAVRRDDAIVSSNTSTIPLKQLIDGMPERFRGDFVITHFFNPPRHMQLLELVESPQTRPEIRVRAADICDRVLGKSIVVCRDTPGFIANRVGNYWMSVAALEASYRWIARDLGISKNTVTAIVRRHRAGSVL